MQDSPRGLTVRAAAREVGVHVQTMRRTVREAGEAGAPVAVKLVGEHGPEWRLCRLVVWALVRESDPGP